MSPNVLCKLQQSGSLDEMTLPSRESAQKSDLGGQYQPEQPALPQVLASYKNCAFQIFQIDSILHDKRLCKDLIPDLRIGQCQPEQPDLPQV